MYKLAVSAARKAAPGWATTSLPMRQSILQKIADLITER
jgi:acyl-CoA reductase-like NAD-dependent aldehyde dehydrogenase